MKSIHKEGTSGHFSGRIPWCVLIIAIDRMKVLENSKKKIKKVIGGLVGWQAWHLITGCRVCEFAPH